MTEATGAVDYHERTKHSPRSVREGSHGLDFENQPRPFKVYRGLDRRPLAASLTPPMAPALEAIADPGPSAGPERPVDLDALTTVCYLAAGITKRIERGDRTMLFRAAACTGALYHVDLYLVTAAVGDLPAGVYHVDPRTLSVDVLREGDHRGVLAAAGGHPRVAEAPVSVVATSTWWRNAWKYRARTYRHAFWDSGTVLANLLATARALDLPAEVALGFADDAVAELLGLEVADEAPLEVVPIGRGEPIPDPVAIEAIDPETEPLSDEAVEYPLIEAAYRGSSLADGDDARAWRKRAPEAPVGTAGPGDGERVALEPVAPGDGSKVPLYHAIRRRGSCREYVREALNARKVATVLDRATRGVRLDVAPEAADGLAFNDVYCLVNGVAEIEPGAYQYHPEARELERLRAGDCREAAGHLALDQALGADAALNVYFMTDLEAVTDALGDRGYRAAQLEAAVTGGRLYLGAYAHRDLGATGLTFYDDAVTEFLSPRAADQTPTFLLTLGRPA